MNKMQKLGKLGGKEVLKKYGRVYFSKLAKKSWRKRKSDQI